MSHLAQHIRTRLVDGRVIARSPAERRIALRAQRGASQPALSAG